MKKNILVIISSVLLVIGLILLILKNFTEIQFGKGYQEGFIFAGLIIWVYIFIKQKKEQKE